jgi:hypothetical protein
MTAVDMAARLPAPDVLERRCKAVAMLDALVSSSELSRRYFFADAWTKDARLGSMADGAGNDYSVAFTSAGTFIRGFDHESPMSPAVNDEELWPGLIDDVPASFADLLTEPAFAYEGVLSATYCIWREAGRPEWRTGDVEFPEEGGRGDVDGSGQLAVLCDDTPATYLAFAESFYGRSLDAAAATRVWNLDALTDEIVGGLRPGASTESFVNEANTIGYPIGHS